jgi:resolvase, N-terminal domain protein
MRKLNVAYLRVSTEAQTEKYGLDVQKQKILDHCEKKGVVIDKWYIDGGYSGSKLDRPKIQELLDDAEKGLIGTVFIYKLDRMSRDVIDTLNLFYKVLPKYGVKVVSMTEDLRTEKPMDRVMLTMNAAMNQYEREVIRMRMSAGMLERVKKGLWMGGGRIPWGYYYDRNDGILHVDEEQAKMVRNAYKLYLEGYSCDKIATMLGFRGERIVTQILKRKSNIGLIEYKGNVYQGKHEPIVDEKLFWDVQDAINKRKTNSHISNNHLLTGLCYCGYCGSKMRYQKWGRSGHRLVCYSHYKSGKPYMRKVDSCISKPERADFLENEIEDAFKKFAIHVDETENECLDQSIILERTIKSEHERLKKMYTLYISCMSDDLLELIKEKEESIKKLQKQLEENEREKGCDVEKIEEIKQMADVWDSLTVKEKNRILKECVEKIIIKGSDIEVSFVTF